MKNKENYHGGFQQQSPQFLVNRYEYMSSRNDDWILWFEGMTLRYYFIGYKNNQLITAILCKYF